jgi:hypothetical protein
MGSEVAGGMIGELGGNLSSPLAKGRLLTRGNPAMDRLDAWAGRGRTKHPGRACGENEHSKRRWRPSDFSAPCLSEAQVPQNGFSIPCDSRGGLGTR